MCQLLEYQILPINPCHGPMSLLPIDLAVCNIASMSWKILCGTMLSAQSLPNECMITSCECVSLRLRQAIKAILPRRALPARTLLTRWAKS